MSRVQIILDLISSTTTLTGLTVHCLLDGPYPTGIAYTATEVDALRLQRHDVHGDWNYSLHPPPTTRRHADKLFRREF